MTYAELIALRDKHDKRPNGFVYFVANGILEGDVFIKIGWTHDMAVRFKVFLRESYAPVPVLIIRASRNIERLLHKRFAEQRYRGEWFRLEGDLHSLMHDFGTVRKFPWEPEAMKQLIECWLLAT